MNKIQPVILCGGSGSRLWPVSRSSLPKQFLRLTHGNSLFQATVQRCTGIHFEKPIIVTSEKFRFLVAHQLLELGMEAKSIILEPESKSTAPAALAATLSCTRLSKLDTQILLVPSDHYIENEREFRACVSSGSIIADKGYIVTFGVNPDKPETGYGYIERGDKFNDSVAYYVSSFVEKPDKEKAQNMLSSGNYFWNSGVFLIKASQIIKWFETLLPEMLDLVSESLKRGKVDLGFFRMEEKYWHPIKERSIDYAVMEHANNLAVIPFSAEWSDLGDWNSVRSVLANQENISDHAGNVLVGNSLQLESKNCLVWSNSKNQIVTAIGLENVALVSMDDAVIAVDLSHSQSVKNLVEQLRFNGNIQADENRCQHKPWGWIEVISLNSSCEVRIVHLYALCAVTLQKHKNRDENITVIQGELELQVHTERITLEVGGSYNIPRGVVHELVNKSKLETVFIEVRTGSYLGDDDVQRYS